MSSALAFHFLPLPPTSPIFPCSFTPFLRPRAGLLLLLFFFLYFIILISKLYKGQAKRYCNASFTILHKKDTHKKKEKKKKKRGKGYYLVNSSLHTPSQKRKNCTRLAEGR